MSDYMEVGSVFKYKLVDSETGSGSWDAMNGL